MQQPNARFTSTAIATCLDLNEASFCEHTNIKLCRFSLKGYKSGTFKHKELQLDFHGEWSDRLQEGL